MAEAGKTPVTLAVVLSLAGVFLVLVSAAAILGSYALALHAVSVNNSTMKALQAREAAGQLHAAYPTCQALRSIDNDAQAILALPDAKNASPPLVRFFSDFHGIYGATNCNKVFLYFKSHKL